MQGIFIAVLLLLISLTATMAIKDHQDRLNTQLSHKDKRNQQIVEMRLSGMSYRKIARRVNVGKSQVFNICKRYGL